MYLLTLATIVVSVKRLKRTTVVLYTVTLLTPSHTHRIGPDIMLQKKKVSKYNSIASTIFHPAGDIENNHASLRY